MNTLRKGGRLAALSCLMLVWGACGEDAQPPASGPGGAGPGAPTDQQPPGGAQETGSAVVTGPSGTMSQDAQMFCGVWEHMLGERPASPPPHDCRTLEGLDRYHCAEHWFWIALSDRLDWRWEAVERLTEVIDADDASDPLALSRMHALRGQLKMAIMVEHGRFDVLSRMRADLVRTSELDPDNPIIPSFLDSIDLIIAYNTGNQEAFEAMEPRIWDNVDRCPLGNVLSISGIAIGLPMETGWPTSIVDALEAWDCSGVDFCTQNTWKAPYARPGLAYHFGEAYARVGRVDEARTYLTRALAEEGVQTWPYRAFVQSSLDELDDWVEDFEALGAEGEAGPLTYAGQTFGCVFCHTHQPPEVLVPRTRLGPDTVILPYDDGGPSSPAVSSEPPRSGIPSQSGSGPAGACDNDADLAILGANEDVGGTVGSCAMSCFGQGEACIATCVQDDTGLSDGCSVCFGGVGQCTIDRCVPQCMDAQSSACQTCQATNCMPPFETCSGVAMP